MKVNEILRRRRDRAFLNRDLRVERLMEAHPDYKAMKKAQRDLGRRYFLAGIGESQEDPQAIQEKLAKLGEEEKAWAQEHGLEAEYFKPDFTCPDCQDQGFIDGRSCHCRNQLLIEKHYNMSSIRRRLVKENFKTANLEVFRKDRQPGEAVSPYENMKDLYKVMEEEYADGFTNQSPNLYFYGSTGTGKTFLASSIAKAVLDQGYTVLYQSASELLDFLVQYSFMYPQDRAQVKQDRDYIFTADLLVIDDLGVERTNDQTIGALGELINQRLLDERPVIISSNIPLDQLADIYGERIASRIQGEYLAYHIFGSDLRRHLN